MASALLRQLVILTTYLAAVVTDPRMAIACTEPSRLTWTRARFTSLFGGP